MYLYFMSKNYKNYIFFTFKKTTRKSKTNPYKVPSRMKFDLKKLFSLKLVIDFFYPKELFSDQNK